MTPPPDRPEGEETALSIFPEVTHFKKRAFLEAFILCGTVDGACGAAGIARRTFYTAQWQEDTAFMAAFARAQVLAAFGLEDEARRRATEGLRQYKFDKNGNPLRNPELCECGHGRQTHGPVLDPATSAVLAGGDPRGGRCTTEGCGCAGFWGQPYYEEARSDVLLIFTLKALLPDKYRETIEFRDGRLKVDWRQLAAQPGGQALIRRIAEGEDWRVVLAGLVPGLLERGILQTNKPRQLPPGPKDPAANQPDQP